MLYLNLITFQVEVIHSFAFASRVELSKDGDWDFPAFSGKL